MKNLFLATLAHFSLTVLTAQTVSERMNKSFLQFESDSQLRHAVVSLYVVDAESGAVVFERNALTGVAPASTQKIITSVTAFELLGKDYHYETELAYSGNISKGVLNGQLILIGSGDPTLGSWRFNSTNPQGFYNRLFTALKAHGIEQVAGKNGFMIDASRFSDETSQDGWIWQDIGNYYGANAFGLNWRENQFDVRFKPGLEGQATSVDSMIPGYVQRSIQVRNEVLTGKAGSGDNTYFYFQNRYRKGNNSCRCKIFRCICLSF
jgi:serine-type D-Ala-D-Ala carboxypeptidase/endopeptidase (penicillin-binding protein 4)